MAECKHTPGPWAFKLGDICGPDDTDGDDLVIAAVGRSAGLRSAQYSTIKSGPIYEANARLIAAAPELLGALKQAVANMAETLLRASGDPSDHDDVERFLSEGGSPSLGVYLSVISKAEGRTHD